MRTTLARLVGLVAATSLMLAPLVAAPVEASTAGTGTLTVNVVNSLGKPVAGVVMLVETGTGDSQVFGTPGAGASTFTDEVPVGSYGVVVFGGWAGITCLGLQTCSFTSFYGGGVEPVVVIPAVVMADQGSQTLTVNTKSPAVVGSGKVGSPLEVTVPTSLTEFSSLYGGGYYGGYSTLPGVTWQANGKAIPGGTKIDYTPTGATSGKTVTALVSYPSIVTYFISSFFHVDATPPVFTTKGIKVTKTKPSLTMVLARTVRQGQRTNALIKLNSKGKPIAGLVQLKIKGKRTVNGLVRAGFSEITLPTLQPGTYQVTAAYGGSDLYSATTVTKKLVVKK